MGKKRAFNPRVEWMWVYSKQKEQLVTGPTDRQRQRKEGGAYMHRFVYMSVWLAYSVWLPLIVTSSVFYTLFAVFHTQSTTRGHGCTCTGLS